MHITWRAGFTNIPSVAAGELRTDAGLEVAVGSADSGGALRVMTAATLVDIDSRTGFTSIPALAIGDVNANADNELIACDTVANAVRIIDAQATALPDITSRSGFGAITSAAVYDVPIGGEG
ncbi:MAG: hypothetical protein GWP08_19655, partial [Nitrospiraceae bacterium]|nr:hypothetical protein [Nitrospiraceae bacterium]